MGKLCVVLVAGCRNKSSASVTLFKFPTDPNLLRKWTQKVSQCCDHWQGQGPGPSAVLWLCSEHFTPDCIARRNSFEGNLTGNRPCRRQLVDGAIPSLFHHTSEPAVTPKHKPAKCDATRNRSEVRTLNTGELLTCQLVLDNTVNSVARIFFWGGHPAASCHPSDVTPGT